MNAPTTHLAFDLGASSGRAILGRLDGARLALEEVHRFTTPLREEEGRLYWDLAALRGEIEAGMAAALAHAPDLASVSADSWGVDYAPLGADGAPLRDAWCYRDPRVAGFMARAFEAAPREAIYAATGIQFMEFNTLYQVLADLAFEPERVRATRTRVMMADYANMLLGGRVVAERSLASTTQLLDVHTGDWDAALMQRLGIDPAAWPPVVAPGTVIGRTPTGAAVVAGLSHDTAAAVAAVPAAPGAPWAYLSCGTWSLLGIEETGPVLTEKAQIAGFTNEAGFGGTVRFLKNLTGLWVLQECEREWQAEGETHTYRELVREAAEAPSIGKVVNLNDARFSYRGEMQQKLRAYCREYAIAPPETRGALVRLILDSMAEGHRAALRELESLIGYEIEALHIVGGGAQNDLLCRLTADACGCKVVAGPAEATAMGNLLIQAHTMGDLPEGMSIRDVVRASVPLKTYEPAVVNGGPEKAQ